jgi:hypothetical protein
VGLNPDVKKMKTVKCQGAGGLAMMVLGIIVIASLLLVSNRVYDGIQSAMPASSTMATAINANITMNVQNAWTLSSITPLVMGASLILAVILGFAAVVSHGRE